MWKIPIHESVGLFLAVWGGSGKLRHSASFGRVVLTGGFLRSESDCQPSEFNIQGLRIQGHILIFELPPTLHQLSLSVRIPLGAHHPCFCLGLLS